MSDILSTTATLDNLLSTFFVKKALPRLVKRAVLYRLAPEKQPLPKGEGTTVRFNSWSNFAIVSNSLSEGTNPSLAAISSRKVEATVVQYGRGIKISDLVEHVSSLDVYNGAIQLLADCGGLSVDKVIQIGVLKNALNANTDSRIMSAWLSAVVSAFHGGTNTDNSGQSWAFPVVIAPSVTRCSAVHATSGTTLPSTSAKFGAYGIRKAVKALRGKDALEFADGFFKCVTNSDAISDLTSDKNFQNWYQSLSSESFEQGEPVRPVEGARIYQSNNMPKHRGTAARSHHVDVSLIFGENAYGVVEINGGKGKGYEIIVKRPGPTSTDNPLNMYGTAAFKFSMVGKALNVSAGRILLNVSDHG